jgi:hypothetical protein
MNRASTVYSANPKRSEGSGRELGTHKSALIKNRARIWALTKRPHNESGANLKHPACFHCVQREPEAQ